MLPVFIIDKVDNMVNTRKIGVDIGKKYRDNVLSISINANTVIVNVKNMVVKVRIRGRFADNSKLTFRKKPKYLFKVKKPK